MAEEVSHGRGGAGNINPDTSPYTDGEIVREGPVGDQGDGAFSTGRGGAANIGSPGQKPVTAMKGDHDVVPEMALMGSGEEDFHTGRGGQGNVHHAPESTVPVGLADKLKHKLFGKKSR